MKKHSILALIMAVVIVIASMPWMSAQAESIGKEALACKNLGILLGADKSGVTTEYLSTIPTRLQAYIIALRLKGLYEEAGKYTSGTTFTDASAAGWAKNYLAYAKNTPELGWGGYPDGRFGVNDKINGQAFYKVMLETLGYKQNVDFTYANTLEFADKIGLIEDASEIATIKSFTTNDIAKGIYRALNTNAAGTDKKLVDLLMDKGIFEPEKVEAAGFNSMIQITARIDLEYGTPMVPVRDTYLSMGSYILENDKNNMSYEIKKNTSKVILTEGFTTAYINSTKAILEKAVMKGKDGIYYVPVSFILLSAGEFGYDAEYIKDKNILRLQKLAEITAAQSEIVLGKGDKKSIVVEKISSDIEKEVITSRCTFTILNNDGTVHVGSTSGEVTGKNVGSAEIIVSYEGKEVDKVTAHVVDILPKYYPAAYYEQVFDTAFSLGKSNFTDGFGAVWNKKPGVIASINEYDGVDTGSSLNIVNYTSNASCVTIDLNKVLQDRAIKGKTSTLKIFAKGIKEGSKLYITATIKINNVNVKTDNNVVLDNKWKSIDLMKIDIPEDAQELTLDIATGQNEEIRIDAFTMTSN